jgi:hypothetical protein
MHAALKLRTKVLAGSRIEVTAPELTEGDDVEVIVLATGPRKAAPDRFASAWEYLQSLPPIHHTAEEWAEIERGIQEEKDAWGD